MSLSPFKRTRGFVEDAPPPIVVSKELQALIDERIAAEVARQVALSNERRDAALPEWLKRSVAFPMDFDALGKRLASQYSDAFRFGTYGDDTEPRWYFAHGNSWLSTGAERQVREAWMTLRHRLIAEAPLDCFEGESDRRIAFLASLGNTHHANMVLASAAEYIGEPI